jgi:hypothetical protein
LDQWYHLIAVNKWGYEEILEDMKHQRRLKEGNGGKTNDTRKGEKCIVS